MRVEGWGLGFRVLGWRREGWRPKLTLRLRVWV